MTEMVVAARAPAPAAGRWGAAPPQELLERLKDYGQEGAFAFWDELGPEERDHLIRDIEVSSRRCRQEFFSLFFLLLCTLLLSGTICASKNQVIKKNRGLSFQQRLLVKICSFG